MDKIAVLPLPLRILFLCVCFAPICLLQCDAARKLSHSIRKLDTFMPLDSSNTDPYVSSPFSLPPYESLPPFPSPENTPPYCVYPPTTIPTPGTGGGYTPIPPPAASTAPTLPGPTPNPPTIVAPSPPSFVPAPTQPVFSPPYYEPSPPYYEPGPPSYVPFPPSTGSVPPYYEPGPPSYVPFPPPTGSVPSPKFLPPIVFPPPAVPPPPRRTPLTAMWCVAKAAVPDPIIQEAMDYACGSGADCDQIQPSGSCFMPNTLFAHASYAFNSYWQRTKVAGGRCDFGGTAILVTVDPSYDGCRFVYF